MIRNFMFHRVNPVRDKLWDPLPVEHFEKCIKYISEHYEIIQIAELPILGKDFKNHRYATISFDDGYKDNITFALPILNKYNIKATFFIITDSIEKNISSWSHVLEYLIQNSKKEEINLHLDFISEEFKTNRLGSNASRISLGIKIIPYLKTLNDQDRKLVIDAFMKELNDVKIPELMMNWLDLQQLHKEGHYIGSHTVTHGLLDKMKDEKEIYYELSNSAEVIKNNIGHFPTILAYPVGNYNATTIRLSKACGYTLGVGTKQNIYHPFKDDIFEIPRIELRNEPWWKTKMRITNLLEVIKFAFRYRTYLLIGIGITDISFD